MRVLKFGGTSVGSAENIRKVAEIVGSYKGQEIAVVVSAMSGVTNKLTAMGRQAGEGGSFNEHLDSLKGLHYTAVDELLGKEGKRFIEKVINPLLDELRDTLQQVSMLKELSKRSMDTILSFGERLSASIVSEYLSSVGIKASYLDARMVLKTDDNFGNARLSIAESYKNIKEHFKSVNTLPVITGFIGSTGDGVTSTLGRGGSDYSASIFGSALKADAIEIWTDVDGVLTADPRKIKDAYSLKSLSYIEAMEMSHFGAKVIYPLSLRPALAKNIPVIIKNTFNPSFAGTIISEKANDVAHPVKGISSIEGVALISVVGSGMFGIPGIASKLFGSLAASDINVILITQASSEHSITFAISPDDAQEAKQILEKAFEAELRSNEIEDLIIEDDLSIVAVIGENMRNTPGISAKLFTALGRNGINVSAIAQGSSELNVSVVINRRDLSKALNALHESFFLSDQKSLNIFLLGTGLIGSTLLDQIKDQYQYLVAEKALNIKVIGIANSRNMHFDAEGIDINNWKEKIDFPGAGVDPRSFVDQMVALNLSNSVFVDCTSNGEVTACYEHVLEGSISIVTPNKLANSGSFANYADLKKLATKRGVRFLYETNVGAGLPIISTMNDLKFSGDKILKIEGILSGTLSYIFNSFVEGVSFSAVVKEAKAQGYTEPDPRDDLNGMDVCRKILILSRESGLPLEIEDVELAPILPESCFAVETVEEFFVELEKADGVLSDMAKKASQEGKKLRYIASMEDGKAKVQLEAVDSDHPFYSLSGSDNIVSFTTKRYFERPLVIKGPGAGAEVTSAGVFAEIISLSSHFIQDNSKFSFQNGR